ncbi:MAG: acylphosphatase [Burkholderiales bacterium]|nr:acylphosphatase [Burkholderiales bacterium]
MTEKVLRLEIRGRVQGVGFRWSMVGQARHLGLRGWVRNRRDGSVEALVAGPSDSVDRLVKWAWRGSAGAVVLTLDAFAGEGSFDAFTGFEQRPTAD